MRPALELTITPDPQSERARVNLVVTVTDEDDRDHDVVLYDELCPIQELSESMSIEAWTASVLAHTASATLATVHALIAGGSRTLTDLASKQQEPLF